MKCKTCKYWQETEFSKTLLDKDKFGDCDIMLGAGVEFILKTSTFDGGYLETVETSINFFCAGYEKR